ncbi:MAG: 2-C-methyl-D-erythritol 4-phosphate cytidylyltransferase, partial [Candidatus Marinimicrobia bacterium CG_4_9_14_3_um_filter_48_9]
MILSSQKSRSNWAVIVAAGSGTRLGGDSPKQFIRLADRELLSFSVDTFLNHPAIDHVV